MSNRKVETYGNIRSGKLTLSYRERFSSALSTITDGRVKVTVEKLYKKRSIPQNAYIHGYLFPAIHTALKEAGYEIKESEVKEMLKLKFLTRQIANEHGEYIEYVKGTSELTTVELMEFIDEVIRWAAEYLNLVLFLPNEQTMLNYDDK